MAAHRRKKVCFTMPKRPRGRFKKGRWVTKRVRRAPAACYVCQKSPANYEVKGFAGREYPLCGKHRHSGRGVHRRRSKFVTVTGYKSSAMEKKLRAAEDQAINRLNDEYRHAEHKIRDIFKRV